MQQYHKYGDMTNYYHGEELYQYIIDDTVWHRFTEHLMLLLSFLQTFECWTEMLNINWALHLRQELNADMLTSEKSLLLYVFSLNPG